MRKLKAVQVDRFQDGSKHRKLPNNKKQVESVDILISRAKERAGEEVHNRRKWPTHIERIKE